MSLPIRSRCPTRKEPPRSGFNALAVDEELNHAIEKFDAWDPQQNSADQIKNILETLWTLHGHAARTDATLKAFPFWAERLPQEKLNQALQKAYSKDIGYVESSAPTILNHFRISGTRLVLLFHGMSQKSAKALVGVIKNRPELDLRSLYDEVEYVRSRSTVGSIIPLKYMPAHFEACQLEEPLGYVRNDGDVDGYEPKKEPNDEPHKVIKGDIPKPITTLPKSHLSAAGVKLSTYLETQERVFHSTADALRSGRVFINKDHDLQNRVQETLSKLEENKKDQNATLQRVNQALLSWRDLGLEEGAGVEDLFARLKPEIEAYDTLIRERLVSETRHKNLSQEQVMLDTEIAKLMTGNSADRLTNAGISTELGEVTEGVTNRT